MTALSSSVDVTDGVYYPSSDGKPLGETPLHGWNGYYLLDVLDARLAGDPRALVAVNMFVYYEEGDPRRHVSPDVFVARGVPKVTDPPRRRYLLWKEGKAPDLVIELTSRTTRAEDTKKKLALYQDTLRVPEYFLFDPYGDYLNPRLQGYRLTRGRYAPVRPLKGRLPSKVLGLHLEAGGEYLRLYDPATGRWLPLPPEEREALQRAEEERRRAEGEVERLRRELEELRRRLPPKG